MLNHKVKRNALIAVILALIIISQTGCGTEEPVSDSQYHLDTQCDITIRDMNEEDARRALEGAFGEISRLEKLVSRTVSGSDVDRINHAEGRAVAISPETASIIEEGLEIGELSGGRFDITIGRVSSLWDFKSDNPAVPDASDLKAAAATVDSRQVSLEGNRVRLKNPEAAIDLGGIAKGFIADQITDYLQEQGVTSAVVNLGGNVEVLGEKSPEEPFVIGIERPYSDRTELIGTVSVSDQTVVTSGVYERKFEQDGVLYHHILDPATGYPVKTDLESVTIVADKGNSCLCDGLATACLMMGRASAESFFKKMQEEYPDARLSAVFVDSSDRITCLGDLKLEPVSE